MNSSSHLPSLPPDTSTSYYPYPLSSRSDLHSILSHTLKPSSIRGGPPSSSSTHSLSSHSRFPVQRPIVNSRQDEVDRVKWDKRALRRAERRAASGKRPAGSGLGREADELSEEEEMMLQERDHTNMFGHRFLLPIGRRQTQMEMDNAPSPTPSDAEHDRRQEDHGVASPMHAVEDGPGGELDLDASLEDLDGDVEDLDEEVEDLDDSMRDGDDMDDEAENDDEEYQGAEDTE